MKMAISLRRFGMVAKISIHRLRAKFRSQYLRQITSTISLLMRMAELI